MPILGMMACGKKKDKVVDGYKPIYAEESNLRSVEFTQGEALVNPGRIYLYQDLLLVNEKNAGVHIYDNSDNTSPIQVSFISIPGNMDFSVRQGVLYADNITDMVAVDISNPASPVFLSRIDNVFPSQEFPDERGAFECVDPSKGPVIGWEKARLTNPKCHR